jgi:hypothetical protein
VDKGYHNGRVLPNVNNTHTTIAHPTPGRSKESVTQPNICSSISVQQPTIPYMSPRRNLKTTEDGTRKAVELSKAVISSRNTEHPLAKNCPVNHYAPVDQQEEKSIEYAQGVEENNKRYQENAIIPNATRDKRTYIRYYKKRQWGYNHTN